MALASRKALSTLHKITVALVLVAVISGVAYGLGLFNRPPKAAFSYRTSTRTLKYIAPTDRDLIMFTNESTDPETPLEKLICNWYVRFNGTDDWKPLNHSTHHWGRLPVSNDKGHEIRLVISDGMKEDSFISTLPVDHAYVLQYAPRRLGIQLKGVCYHIGRYFKGDYGNPPSDIEMQETLTVIRDELGCNSVKIWGGYEDVMAKCAKTAIEMGFKEVILDPRYQKTARDKDITISEHKQRIIEFAKTLEALRLISDSIVYSISDELSVDVIGIVNASDYFARGREMEGKWGTAEYNAKLNSHLRDMLAGVRSNFKGRCTYAAAVAEAEGVDWSGLGFDMVAPHLYYSRQWYTEARILTRISKLRQHGKPMRITEFGCLTYKGASLYGGNGYTYYKDQDYSQEEQAMNIIETLEIFNKAGTAVGGVYLFEFLERHPNDAVSYGVIRFEKEPAVRRRKLGFYAYQSFVVAA